MNVIRRINLSAAVIGLVCFFLPWVHVSCAGAKETMSGVDLARHDDVLLWLIPLLTCAVLVMGLLRVWREKPYVSAIMSAVCGAVLVFLMNRERLRVQDQSGVLAAQLTGWFWLASIAAVAIVVSGVAVVLPRRQTP